MCYSNVGSLGDERFIRLKIGDNSGKGRQRIAQLGVCHLAASISTPHDMEDLELQERGSREIVALNGFPRIFATLFVKQPFHRNGGINYQSRRHLGTHE